jgi:hypothetical protein
MFVLVRKLLYALRIVQRDIVRVGEVPTLVNLQQLVSNVLRRRNQQYRGHRGAKNLRYDYG